MEITKNRFIDEAGTMNFTSADTLPTEKESIAENADRYFLSMDGELLNNNKCISSGTRFSAEFEIF